ncbi:alpha/beta hydrolase [bacterium]|nr:MAG: alpha/beta hydrolase [bacterium]
MFVLEIGSGLPVVLIHGYPLNHRTWENQFSLSDSFRILAPDLPGFGQSGFENALSMEGYSDHIAELLDEKKIEKAVVMGHSMGGYISLAFAARHENRVMGLGLICSQAGADTEEARAGRLKNAERVEKEGFDFIIATMSEKLLSPYRNTNDSALQNKLKLIMKEASAQGVTTALKAMAARKDQFETLRNLSVPVFITAGTDDVLIAVEKSVQMAEASKLSTFEVFEGCGHMPMMEKPQEFNLALRKFLKKISL